MGAGTARVIAMMALGVFVACGGNTTGSTGSGDPGAPGGSSNGGAPSGGASSGGVGGAECKTDADCSYPLICISCSDGVDSCPTGATCESGICSTTYSHECPSGGSGGAGGGGTGGVSAGTATIVFSVSPGSQYCSQHCIGGGSISVADASGTLDFSNWCQTDCATCQGTLCPPVACAPDEAITGARLDWDGKYYASVRDKCGAGTTCLEQRTALPGKYTAKFCATPGTMSGVDAGSPTCSPTGLEKCTSVEFQFPSSAVATGTL